MIMRLAFVLTFLPLLSFAGAKVVGNGGSGLKMNGRIYILDLAEAGLQLSPISLGQNQPSVALMKRVHGALGGISPDPSKLVAAKLAEIQEKDPVLAWVLLRTLEAYSWKLTDTELEPIPVQDSVLQFQPEDLVQLAARVRQDVLMQRRYWRELDATNQTALVFHEILYSLVPPHPENAGSNHLSQSSLSARLANADLFSPAGFDRVRFFERKIFNLWRPKHLLAPRIQEDANSFEIADQQQLVLKAEISDSQAIVDASLGCEGLARFLESIAKERLEETGEARPLLGFLTAKYQFHFEEYKNPEGLPMTYLQWTQENSVQSGYGTFGLGKDGSPELPEISRVIHGKHSKIPSLQRLVNEVLKQKESPRPDLPIQSDFR